MTLFIHQSADVQSQNIGPNSKIWQYVVILPDAIIGSDANICSHCFIESDVRIGNRVTIKAGVQIWDGIEIGDDVFIGPNVSFTNDRFPKSKQYQKVVLKTNIENGVSIGAGAVILPGINLGQHAMIGAGAVVTKNVPPYAIVVGNPARIVGYMNTERCDKEPSRVAEHEPRTLSTSLTKVKGVKVYRFPLISDIRGSLTAGEFHPNLPFHPKRYFMVFNVPSKETRGEHAHRVCHQFLMCVHGSCAVSLDDGDNRTEIILDSPEKGVYVPPMTWGVQYKYTNDAVLLVFASDYYDAGDYIRNYSQFINEINNMKINEYSFS